VLTASAAAIPQARNRLMVSPRTIYRCEQSVRRAFPSVGTPKSQTTIRGVGRAYANQK
jgi:hypothetical protein